MAADQLLGTLLFMYNMLNAQITTSFVILTSFRRVDEVTRTLEAKLSESRKQYEAARLRARRRHRMQKTTTLFTRLMQLGVSERRMWMLRRPQGARNHAVPFCFLFAHTLKHHLPFHSAGERSRLQHRY